MSAAKVIETSGLSKKFMIGESSRDTLLSHLLRFSSAKGGGRRELWALKDVNIDVKKGEMIAVIGPNGSGKSTLLRILSGIMAPTSGSFTVSEEVFSMFELGFGFNPRFTALENVFLYAALHGIRRKEMAAQIDRIVEFSGLEGFMDMKLSEFSSGMKARLAFAAIIRTARGIVMVDEVLVVGDIGFQKKCVSEFGTLLAAGNTIVFVSQAVGNVKQFCTRALYLDRGRQVVYGPVREVEEMYAASFGD